MVVFILERARASVRGELSRWLIEPRAGVFVGAVSAEVRDRLWDMVSSKRSAKAAGLLIHSSNTEQRFRIRTFGEGSRQIVDYEGLRLARRPVERRGKQTERE